MSGISTISGAVLAIVTRGERLLLVQRRNPPDQGLWGFPGGRINVGESFMHAAERELQEETGFVTTAQGPLTAFDLIDRDAGGVLRFHYLIVAVKCLDTGGDTLRAGDDACDVGWFDMSQVRDNPPLFSKGLLELGELALSSRGVIAWPHATQHRGDSRVPATGGTDT
ncbi:NUDIX hydrolase [Gluconacetobacter entanii]|uniref:NUDIX hydrolase n=1 Tax=Gluconacetobacter entanii TaxID=108528 RepID=A0ABT3K3Y3_9PROT|nr:NUDIX hydrolase [Gluconacetobacter entanii]MBE7618955.1 NUDIX domain-containing protein [Komagataeibacter sp. FXV2]MCW4590129.1 NUDIX hydrolase [Gluconacetobacter entanii]MCW4593268.1 NUDIX hydrolase [Gluconacetobacter entanii]NPC88259.1 NUDIX hydrolase [Gluconacetobacter entanii]